MDAVILKKGKEKPLLNRHPWIFSGAVAAMPQGAAGEIYPIYSHSKELLGYGYFNAKASIAGRVLSFGDLSAREALKQNLVKAIEFRKTLFSSDTTAYRIVNGEGDFIPGLIVDKYGDHLVIQVGTLGIEQLKGEIVSTLQELIKPQAIYEKSSLPSRKEEGLKEMHGWLTPVGSSEQTILENGLQFRVSLTEGQKTGFFLDQREMRQKVRTLSNEKMVLNCFGYTGGFSVYAAAGGAKKVDTLDISEKAIQLAQINMELNAPKTSAQFFTEDVFTFLRNHPLNYDLAILDPPAFAKRQKDVVQACRGYKDINRLAIQKMPPNSFLITCSCSHFVDEKLFTTVVFQAASEAKRSVQILGRHILAPDHPINLSHPEGSYLKSLYLKIS